MLRLEGRILKSIQTSQILISVNLLQVQKLLQIDLASLTDKQIPISHTSRAGLIEQEVLTDKGLLIVKTVPITDKILLLDKEQLIDQVLPIGREFPITDKVLLIDKESLIGKALPIDREFPITDKEILIGVVQNLIIKSLQELGSQ